MQLKYKETLSRQDLTAILTLTDAAEEFDGFLTSVQKDTDEDFPCFFLLAYDEETLSAPLAGFFSCMLYTDSNETEDDDLIEASVTLLVHPDYRRMHLGTELLTEGKRRGQRLTHGQDLLFETTINAESTAAAAFVESLDFSIVSTQLMMTVGADTLQQMDVPDISGFSIRLCRNKRLLASIYRDAFEMSAASAVSLMEETLSDPHVTAFVCEAEIESCEAGFSACGGSRSDNSHSVAVRSARSGFLLDRKCNAFSCQAKKQPVGMSMLLSYSSKKSYFFNIVVTEPYQRRHLATAMILHAAASLPSEMQIHLQVDAENEPAVCCYEKLGFSTVQAVKEVEGIL